MAALQLIIDQLEARASELDSELLVLDAELQELSAKGKELAKQADSKREKSQHLKHAAGNLRIVQEYDGEAEQPETPAVDPWGDAG